MTTLNQRIKEMRHRQAGLTQENLAEMVGLTRVQLAKIELGLRKVSSLELAHFAEAFDVREEELLRTSGAPLYRAPNIDSPEAQVAIEWFDAYVEDSVLMRRMDELGA